jgi:hypothetical protein
MSEQAEYTYDVFISYSHTDQAWVWDELLPRLEEAGLRVCIDDRDFKIGVPSLINMERAVDNSRHTLIVLTPAWVESQWTEFESLLAGTADPAGRRLKIIPLMLKSCKLPSRIAMLTYADFTQPHDHVNPLSRLVSQLRHTTIPAKPVTAEVSPFVAGPPIIHPRQFFGRERELKRLFNLWKGPPLQNAAVIGPRRSGKTSLLLYLKSITTTPPAQLRPGQRADWLPEPERYRWIFVDFQDPRVGSREGLLRYLLNSLDLPMLAPSTGSGQAPSTSRCGEPVEPSGQAPCDLDRFMDVVSRSLRSPTVVLLDEIGVALESYPELDDSFWEGLRSLATTQVGGNLAFVLAASKPPDQLARHSNLGSPFFNVFGYYTATLGPLTEPEARELIASSPIPFPPADVDWILVQSGRWPLLLQILCRERLITLEEGETDDTWREDGLHQITPFQHLLT